MISNCIFTWAITREGVWVTPDVVLWIDFKLYFYVSNHKITTLAYIFYFVVNWFQIVFLREQSQGRCANSFRYSSCELISNCIFTWAITSLNLSTPYCIQLWIDFKLYFYVSNHKANQRAFRDAGVVNWFQIVFLREQSQEKHF